MRAGRRPWCGAHAPGPPASSCGRWTRLDGATARDRGDDDCRFALPPQRDEAREWPWQERLLLERALDWWGAVDGAIGYAGATGPYVRAGADSRALRGTLIALAKQVHAGRAAGMPVERIVAVTRLEPDLVREMLSRAPGELPNGPVDQL